MSGEGFEWCRGSAEKSKLHGARAVGRRARRTAEVASRATLENDCCIMDEKAD